MELTPEWLDRILITTMFICTWAMVWNLTNRITGNRAQIKVLWQRFTPPTNPLDFECPYCGAVVGVPCKGGPSGVYHGARVEASGVTLAPSTPRGE